MLLSINANEQAMLDDAFRLVTAGSHMLLVMAIALLFVVKLLCKHYIGAAIHLVGGAGVHFLLEQSPQTKLGEGEYVILFFYLGVFALLWLWLTFSEEEEGSDEK